jgi:hypothetical protein
LFDAYGDKCFLSGTPVLSTNKANGQDTEQIQRTKKKKKQERKIHRVDTQNSQKENTDVNPGARER